MNFKLLVTAIAALTLVGCATSPYSNQRYDTYNQRAPYDQRASN